jgi:alpha-mannosidase
MEVHWLETGSDSTDSPMLKAVFPLNMDNPRFYCQVPFDVVERPVDGKINGSDAPYTQRHADAYGIEAEKTMGQEVPAQHWVDVTDGTTGIALLNRTKYGHAMHNGELSLTLMRSAGEPDIYPNLGKFSIHYALFPHSGDWKNGAWVEGDRFNVPVFAAEPPSLALGKEHATLPEEMSFLSMEGAGVIFSGMKKSEDGNELIIRLAEVEGKESGVTLNLPVIVKSARRLNLVEMPLTDVAQPLVNGKSVRVKIRPHEIVTLGINPQK